MIEYLEFSNLHLKADRLAEDPIVPICSSSKTNHSNSDSLPRISAPSSTRSELVFDLSKTLSGALNGLNRNENQLLILFGRKAAIWAAFCSPATSAPTPSGSLCDGRKEVVGAGFLVHLAAHIAELNKNTSSIQSNIKNPRFQRLGYVIGLRGLVVTFFGSSFQKISSPGTMAIAGDIRRLL